ncbi:MAG TPA: diacylglycerol kinase family protein [Bacteroidales bacterium]|nr:diacylglycerol kinase family protein [Bacteroidales bacterium]
MSEAAEKKWLVVINPNAGVKKGAKEWPAIHRLLEQEGFPMECVLTEYRGHAIQLTEKYILGGYRNFAVVGGDGTLNEVLNGFFIQRTVPVTDLTLAMIPVGTGNDWGRSFGIPFDHRKAVQVLKRNKTVLQDVGKINFFKGEESRTRYFLNVAGMGYDALVAKKTNLLKEKGRGGALAYIYFVFASLFQYRFMDAVIEVDGKEVYNGGVFSMNAGICKYNGGGMIQVPDAVPDDGILDFTLIRKASKWVVVRYAHKLYDGTISQVPIVSFFRGKSFRVSSGGKIYLEADGESLGHTPFTIEILPLALKVVTGHQVPGAGN